MKEILLDNCNDMIKRGLSTPANIGCTAGVAALVVAAVALPTTFTASANI